MVVHLASKDFRISGKILIYTMYTATLNSNVDWIESVVKVEDSNMLDPIYDKNIGSYSEETNHKLDDYQVMKLKINWMDLVIKVQVV